MLHHRGGTHGRHRGTQLPAPGTVLRLTGTQIIQRLANRRLELQTIHGRRRSLGILSLQIRSWTGLGFRPGLLAEAPTARHKTQITHHGDQQTKSAQRNPDTPPRKLVSIHHALFPVSFLIVGRFCWSIRGCRCSAPINRILAWIAINAAQGEWVGRHGPAPKNGRSNSNRALGIHLVDCSAPTCLRPAKCCPGHVPGAQPPTRIQTRPTQ